MIPNYIVKQAYCLNCDKDVDYSVKREVRNFTNNGYSFSVPLDFAFCVHCGKEVYPHELTSKNDIRIRDECKKCLGLLTSEDIISLRKKRGLSQVQLARLISCGDKNIARYETGSIQDASIDLLMRLANDEQGYKLLKKLNNKKK